MLGVRIRYFDERPIQIVDGKRNGFADAGQLIVVQEDHARRPQQTTEIEEVDEYRVETMITIYEGEIERRV